MIGYRPERILVLETAWEDPPARDIVARFPEVPVETVASVEDALPGLNSSSDPRASGKRTLMLTRHRGRFMKDCPGAGAEICCNYFVVGYQVNCHLECSYCFLQSYLTNPAIQIYTNLDDLIAEVGRKVAGAPGRFFRIGTGELADSLALDDITGYSRRLVPFFGSLPNAVLELKTKTDRIGNLADLDHRGRTVVSWSVNCRSVTSSEELKTADFDERLEAARRCQEWGYRVGFHFDPLIHFPGWEGEYRSAVRDLFRRVDPSMIAWISLGALRFTPRLREIVRSRFPKSLVPYGEFVPGCHSKLRYFRTIREEMYSKMRHWIAEAAPRVFVYLCMESRAAWEQCFDAPPAGTEDLSRQMDGLVRILS